MLSVWLFMATVTAVHCQRQMPKVPLPQASTELMLNTSDVLSSFWVKTVIEVRPDTGDDVYSPSFRSKMELKLAESYNLAMWIRSNSKTRRRRAATLGNATVQITNITREYFANPLYTDLIYYLVQNQNFSTITPAQETVSLMNLLSTEQVSTILGYPVKVTAEPYTPEPPPPTNNLWIIGAVIGGVIGLIILIWLILFIYIKCTRPPKRSNQTPRSMKSPKEQDANGTQSTARLDTKALTTLTTENEEQGRLKEQGTSARSPVTAEKYVQVGSQHGEDLYAQVVKRHKTTSADVGEMPRRKKRQKKSAKTENDVDLHPNGTFTETEDPDSDGWLDVKVEKSETMQSMEENGLSLKPPIHTPLYVGMNSNRSRILWDPYEAGDVSAKILTTEEQVTPSQMTHSKPKRKHSVDSVNSPTVSGKQKSPETIEMPQATMRTLNALRDAGLLPLQDYTSVVLDTKTFGPRPKSRTQETSVDERETNRSSRNPYSIPGQPRPVWSVEDEPELEDDIEEIGHAKVHGSRTSLKYSEDEIDDSGRSNDSGITGGQRNRRKNHFLKFDNEEHSSNA